MLTVDPRRLIGRVFPIVQWSRFYDLNTGIGDLIAGITVALTLIPQSIAYASLAGFEPQYGLYASFAGGFVYAVMGTCPQINIGPTALLSLLTFTYTNGMNADYAVLLCFIGGIIQLLAGIVQLGFLVEFVSLPVVSGFTSAAAITIASSQIKGLLGLKFKAENFISTWRGVFHHIGETKLEDTLLGLSCCIVLMGMKALKDVPIKDKDEKSRRSVILQRSFWFAGVARNAVVVVVASVIAFFVHQDREDPLILTDVPIKDKDEKSRRSVILQRSFWFAGVARNAVVVVVASVIAFFVHQDREDPLILTGNITPGLPKPQLPSFQSTVGNTTVSAADMFAHLGSGLLVVPLVGVISNVAIAKAFSKGKTLDATQEIVALGACNIIGAFFRSFPVNGSFTRSAVSDASGVRTPAAGFYTGIIVLLTLGVLTPYFYFIPRAALAAVIVCAVLHMVDARLPLVLWKTTRLDLIPLVGTFLCCLILGIELGLGCGVLLDVLLILYYNSRPHLNIQYVEDSSLPPHYSVHPIGGLHFASAERVRSALSALRNPKSELTDIRLENLRVIQDGVTNGTEHRPRNASILVVHCNSLTRLDYTFIQSTKMLVNDWSSRGHVVWCDATNFVRTQLSSELRDATFIDSVALPTLLLQLVMATQTTNSSDTRL